MNIQAHWRTLLRGYFFPQLRPVDQARKPAREALEAMLQNKSLAIPILCLEFLDHIQKWYGVFDISSGCVIDDDYFAFFPAIEIPLFNVACEGVCKLLGVE